MADDAVTVSARAATVRLATDADGPAIGKLFSEASYADFGVDWSAAKVHGWWLVAEADDRFVGAVMLCAAQPFGYLGDIIVHPDYRGRDGEGHGILSGRLGKIAYDLLMNAFVALRAAGSQMVIGAISQDQAALKAVYERHGALDFGTYTLMGRRLL